MEAEVQVEPTTSTSSRDVLAAAIGRERAAVAALESASIAVKQARAAVEEVKSHLARFDDLDERIAAARAEMVKRNDSGSLPRALINEREARRVARERLDECNSALALLEAQRGAAEKTLREASEAVSVDALHVILDEATALSNGLHAAQMRQWHLADSLYALDLMVNVAIGTLPHGPKGALRQRLGRLLQPLNAQRPEPPPLAPNSPLRLEAALWRALHAELRRDPNAQPQATWEK